MNLTDDILGQASASSSDFASFSQSNVPPNPSLSGSHDLITNNSPQGGYNPFSGAYVSDVTAGVNPMLDGLANNGGPTQTMASQVGSPVIGGGHTR